MKWENLPVWVKLRMLINQKIQSNIINSSVFINNIEADIRNNGFNWSDSLEDSSYWVEIFGKNKIPKESEKLYVYESTPGKYGVKMSHSDVYLYFTKQELSDLGLTNPIVEKKGSCKYHTFEEHLNNRSTFSTEGDIEIECLSFQKWASDNAVWDNFVRDYEGLFGHIFTMTRWINNCKKRNYRGVDIVKENVPTKLEPNWIEVWNMYVANEKKPLEKEETNPECLAFKEWALKEESAVDGKSLWDVFVLNTEHWMKRPFNEEYWMEECNKRYTGYFIITSFVSRSLHAYWRNVYKLFQSQKKSPAEIFIEWAKKNKHVYYTWDLLLKGFKDEDEAIRFISSCTNLTKMVNHIYFKVKKR